MALERGLAGTSVADVAERAGVHPTSIYRRWGDREHLLADALLRGVEEGTPVPDTGSLEGDLRRFLADAARTLDTPQGRLLLRLAVTVADDPNLVGLRDRYWSQALADAGRIFERAEDRGELAGVIDPVTAVELILGPLYMRAIITGEPLDEAFVERLVRLVLSGIRR